MNNSFWDFLLWLFWFYVLIACIWIFITVIIDIFKDHTLNGWAKALWVIFLVFLPFLAAFIYLIARGNSMAQRRMEEAQQIQAQNADYIRTVAGTGGGGGGASSASEIETAKRLLDSGAINQAEYEQLKAKAIAG
ncbi:SHOCT domain-containing protein [Agromyces sp. NPDC057679]|uniref:SHOCT domain-containing protein n=1 Tax=Agromyces sp. NPDC057679 TaxID=3346207 RepID=UPI0036710BD5